MDDTARMHVLCAAEHDSSISNDRIRVGYTIPGYVRFWMTTCRSVVNTCRINIAIGVNSYLVSVVVREATARPITLYIGDNAQSAEIAP